MNDIDKLDAIVEKAVEETCSQETGYILILAEPTIDTLKMGYSTIFNPAQQLFILEKLVNEIKSKLD